MYSRWSWSGSGDPNSESRTAYLLIARSQRTRSKVKLMSIELF